MLQRVPRHRSQLRGSAPTAQRARSSQRWLSATRWPRSSPPRAPTRRALSRQRCSPKRAPLRPRPTRWRKQVSVRCALGCATPRPRPPSRGSGRSRPPGRRAQPPRRVRVSRLTPRRSSASLSPPGPRSPTGAEAPPALRAQALLLARPRMALALARASRQPSTRGLRPSLAPPLSRPPPLVPARRSAGCRRTHHRQTRRQTRKRSCSRQLRTQQ
mmetsp:Transcript_10835/g.27340  ORF Transcript_10835/g.27340 Transcript_10835/m.27340 type:complete len:215 (+) Transcript_10835:2063-2707(+)